MVETQSLEAISVEIQQLKNTLQGITAELQQQAMMMTNQLGQVISDFSNGQYAQWFPNTPGKF